MEKFDFLTYFKFIEAVSDNLFFLNSLGSMTLMVQIGIARGTAGQPRYLIEPEEGFPGHGGFLDRVGGILFAAWVIWAILNFHT